MPHESEGWRVFTCYWTGYCCLINWVKFHRSEIDHSEISIMSPVLKTPFNILYAHQAPKKAPRHKKQFLVIFPALSCYVKLMSDPQATATCVHILLVFGKEAAWVTLSPESYQDDHLGDVPPQAGNVAGVKSSPLKREVIRSGVGRIGKDYHLVQFY